MTDQYIVNGSDLTAIADSIRAKTGETDQLAFPSGFKTAIEGIQSGGGGGATEPYVEETYDSNGNLIQANLVGYTKIRNYQFYNCSKLALTSLPSGITYIGNCAFDNCTGLTNITFQGTPSNINSSAFNSCPNLTTINVPWAEGAVANAPWGATNATINYNYTGE